MKLLVRPATAADVICIARHNQSMAWETESIDLDYDQAMEGVRTVIEDPTLGFYLVAELGKKVVGSLFVTYEWSDWRNGMRWWLQSIYVQPEFRRQGVFSGMLDHVRSLGAREHILGLMLYVVETNEGALKAYDKLQFKLRPYRILSLNVN
jgi:GNAT superfamily N-acetyltransferase